MKVTAITATCGRHTCIERSVRLFLDQDYKNAEMLIFNNSSVSQLLDRNVPDKVKLVNCSNSLETGKPYSSLGQIYRDAIKFISEDTDIIIFWDDDDLFLPNHISEGVKGYKRALEVNKIAYKPQKSYDRYMTNPVKLTINTMEPSIFTKAEHIKKYGFSDTTTEQHLQWVRELGTKLLLEEPNGTPTMIYNWGDDFPTFKTSGDYSNLENFNNYRNFSQDHGDRIITPIESYDIQKILRNEH